MKRVLFFIVFLMVIGLGPVVSNDGVWTCQDQQELIPSEDSVSVDDLDPIFYEAEEDETAVEEKSDNSSKLIIGAVGVVILLGLGFLFINRSRSQKKE